MRLPSAYAGERITFATIHGKEELAREPFRRVLGAHVSAPEHLDTDQFGTFSGEIARTLTPLAAARAKAQLGMQLDGTTLGLASEGSFSGGFGPVVEHAELLLFIDGQRAMELIETAVEASPIPGGRVVSTPPEALRYAAAAGFPRQGLIVQALTRDGPVVRKNLNTARALEDFVTLMLDQADPGTVRVEPDYRAHLAPSRAAVVRSLAERMAARLITLCSDCGAPGFGRVRVERGLRCSACNLPTNEIAADVLECGACASSVRMPRSATAADPRWCDYCNP